MERKRIICLFLFIGLVLLVFSGCHPRHVSDIKLAMTKEEVVSLWGQTNLITYKTVNGTTLETWEYHFAGSNSICQITFVQDRVTAYPKCDRSQERRWYYSLLEPQPYSGPYYYPYPYYPYPYYSYPYYFGGYYDFWRPYYYPYRHYHHHHHPRRR